MDRTIPASKTPLQLYVELQHRAGALALDTKFSLVRPWTVLFGPSGSGKTTILRAIAGLIHPDSARIFCTGIDLPNREKTCTYVDTGKRIFLAAHKRRIPLAAQRPGLFPHMTVRRQIAYALRLRPNETTASGVDSIETKTSELLTLFRIAHLAGQYPNRLSGGESQRVNLARATASASSLLLLDEPFNGLEFALRSQLMRELQSWAASRNISVLSVTHDIAEAYQLDAEVIQIADGRIVQQGPASQVLAEERLRLLRQLGSVETPAPSSEPYLSG